MALYHLSTKTVKKSKGQSALKKAQYNSRLGKYKRQEDKKFFEMHGNMPSFVGKNPMTFWKAADRFERSNGRTAREVEFALPVELSRQEQIVLAQNFTRHVVKDAQPYSLVLHEGGGSNPHAHLLFSERSLDGVLRAKELFFKRASPSNPALGGAAKDRRFSGSRSKDWLKDVRQAWADYANKALMSANLNARIDHRSLKDQGAQRTSGEHLGPRVTAMVRRGEKANRFDDVLRRHDAHQDVNGLERELEQLNKDIDRVGKRRKERSL